MGKRGVGTAWTIIAAIIALFASAWPAAAQTVTVDPGYDIGVPSFSGSGLDGEIGNSDGPLAIFNAPVVCYPDCSGEDVFDPSSGTLVDFTSGTITNLDVVRGSGAPGITGTSTTLSGFIYIPTSGLFEFDLTASEVATLSVGDQSFVGSSGGLTGTTDATFTQAGLYPLILNYMEDSSQAVLDLIVTDLNNPYEEECVTGCSNEGGPVDNGNLYSAEDAAQLEGAPLPPVGAGLPGLAVLAFAGAGTLRRRRALR